MNSTSRGRRLRRKNKAQIKHIWSSRGQTTAPILYKRYKTYEQLLLKVKRTLDQFQGLLHYLISSFSFSYGTRLTTQRHRPTIVNKKSCALAQENIGKAKRKNWLCAHKHPHRLSVSDCLAPIRPLKANPEQLLAGACDICTAGSTWITTGWGTETGECFSPATLPEQRREHFNGTPSPTIYSCSTAVTRLQRLDTITSSLFALNKRLNNSLSTSIKARCVCKIPKKRMFLLLVCSRKCWIKKLQPLCLQHQEFDGKETSNVSKC